MAKSTKKKNIVIKMDAPKRGPGRPRKDVVITETDIEGGDIPGLFQPTEYDLNDELMRMDAFNATSFN